MPLLATRRFSQAAQTHPAFSIQHRSGVDYASWFIQGKVESLAGKYTFSPEDGEDIFQDLALHLIRQWPLYQPGKAKPTTFIQNIVNRRVAEMLRNDQRLCRDDRDDVRLSFACEYGVLDGVRGQPLVEPQELQSLSIDCEEILNKLPDDLRTVAEMLKEMNPSEVARTLGLSEGALWRRMSKLKTHFIAGGYDLHDSDSSDQENA